MTSTASADLLLDAFGRVRDLVHAVLDGLGADDLAYRVDDEANSIAWLVWHLTRIEDDHVAHTAGTGQAWFDDGWAARFDLPLRRGDTGYGHSTAEVAAVVASAELLAGYHDAVYVRTVSFVEGLAEADLARVVDERWDPPVTMGVRLVSVLGDAFQHVGQAAYVKGLRRRRSD
jgi:Protein of unknown function (DUF664)